MEPESINQSSNQGFFSGLSKMPYFGDIYSWTIGLWTKTNPNSEHEKNLADSEEKVWNSTSDKDSQEGFYKSIDDLGESRQKGLYDREDNPELADQYFFSHEKDKQSLLKEEDLKEQSDDQYRPKEEVVEFKKQGVKENESHQEKQPQLSIEEQILKALEPLIDDEQKQVCGQYLLKGQISKFKKYVKSNFGQKSLNKVTPLLQQMPQKQKKQPVKGSKFAGNVKGIDLYVLPTFSSSKYMTGETKTALVVGMTGVGKSTYLNSLVNKIMEVEADDPFRYIIIDDSGHNQAKSVTSEVTAYVIPRQGSMKYNIALIDVPGMGDSSGIQKDKQNLGKIKKKLSEDVPELNLILYVFKSSDTRITKQVEYVINQVTGMFAKDVAASFQFVLTFADMDVPPVVGALQETFKGTVSGLQKQGWYLKVNNAAIFRKINLQDPMETNYFQIGMQCLDKTLKKLYEASKVSTKQTVTVLQKIEQTEVYILSLHCQVDKNLAEQQHLRQLAGQVANKKADIHGKKGHTFLTKVQKPVEYKTENNVTTCMDCKFTCHDSCAYSNGIDKQHCYAMSDGICRNCPKKCSWRLHANQHYVIKYQTVQETVTNEDLLKQYNVAIGEKNQTQSLLIKMAIKFCEANNSTVQIIRELKKANEYLKQIQLMPIKATSVIDYIQLLIGSQEAQKKQGYYQRVRALRQIQQSEERKLKALQDLSEQSYSFDEIIQKIKSFIKDDQTREKVIKGVQDHYSILRKKSQLSIVNQKVKSEERKGLFGGSKSSKKQQFNQIRLISKKFR